jgi:hypothetical protein
MRRYRGYPKRSLLLLQRMWPLPGHHGRCLIRLQTQVLNRLLLHPMASRWGAWRSWRSTMAVQVRREVAMMRGNRGVALVGGRGHHGPGLGLKDPERQHMLQVVDQRRTVGTTKMMQQVSRIGATSLHTVARQARVRTS